jgi:inorganic pyrophosphatase
MSIKIIFLIFSIVCGLSAFIPYLFDTFKLKTKPHIYTWIIWALTQGTATFAIFYGGGRLGGVELAIGVILQIVVIIFSLKYGTKDITKSDAFVLVIALLAILVWWQLKQPILSVVLVSAIDVFGYIPTFRKSYKDPWSETLATWILFAMSDIFAVLALSKYNFLTVTYLATITVVNVSFFIFCTLRRSFSKKVNNYATNFLGKTMTIKIDRPIDSKHPKHGFVYEVNYGFVPGTKAPDGEEVDAYVLDIKEPVKEFFGKCIAIIHRKNDNDDKLIVVSENAKDMSDEEILKAVNFQEKWFDSVIIR